MPQNVTKSMTKTTSLSPDGFQQGGCFSSATRAFYRPPEHSWTSDRPQKQATGKID